MKILILDTSFPAGHKNLNSKLISLMGKDHDLEVLNYKAYYNKLERNSKIKICNIPFLIRNKKKGVFLKIIVETLNSFIIGVISCFKRYDSIVVFTFDTVTFPFLLLFLRKQVYIFHHNNTDHLQNKKKRKIFKTYMNKVHHIVFADFIKEYLIKEVKVNSYRVHTIPHPLTIDIKEKRNPKQKDDNQRYFIGLGHANDELLINEVIAYEDKNKLLNENGIQLILRSNIRTYSGKNIKVISGFLPRDVYDDFYKKCDALIILYPLTYKYRYSGSFLEAFINKKKLLGTDIPIIRHLEQRYPSTCSHFTSIAELFYKMINLNKGTFITEYEKFIFYHSDENIIKKLNSLLSNER